MSELNSNNATPPISLSHLGWGGNVTCVICPNCDWRYLAVPGRITDECPHCHARGLQVFQSDDFSMMTDFIKPPEMYLPFHVPQEKLSEKLTQFAKTIPFAPEDLTIENLFSRLRMVFLPMWLVDSHVKANWQAECGFYYQAKSHQEKYSGGRWNTQEVIETRTRWEPRLGKLTRQFHNISAPALDEHRRLMSALGNYPFEQAKAIAPSELFGNATTLAPMVRIPSRDKDDAWPDTLPRFQERASEETRQACAADQIREFKWKPEFSTQNWTLFLLPMWSSYYLDDENKPQSILVNGQSSQMSGSRQASMKKAKKVSLTILIVALVILALAIGAGLLGMLVPGLMLLAGIGLVISIIVGLAAIYPIAKVWSVNRRE